MSSVGIGKLFAFRHPKSLPYGLFLRFPLTLELANLVPNRIVAALMWVLGHHTPLWQDAKVLEDRLDLTQAGTGIVDARNHRIPVSRRIVCSPSGSSTPGRGGSRLGG